MPFSTRNSVIAHLYGCVIVASLTKNKQTTWKMLRIIYCDKQSSFEVLLEKDSRFYSREEHPNISYRNV